MSMFVTFVPPAEEDGHVDLGCLPRSVAVCDNSLLHLHNTHKLNVLEIREFDFLCCIYKSKYQIR